ncbi:MAG: M28 family peptidase [Bacteroidales bacterium]|nr:M28 family peptidase [Bacteroidales bacterium]
MHKTAFLISLTLSVMMISCNENKSSKQKTKAEPVVQQIIEVPEFNADSAFEFVKAQCDFGPRVPGTQEHKDCASYLSNQLKKYTTNVIVQNAKVRMYNNELQDCKNIVASFAPDKKERILLAAHWDSRFVADHDPIPANRTKAVPGANDGASGVGVLMEIARVISKNQPDVGVDIILFDMEDQGAPESKQTSRQNTWGLGSQYWAANPHIFGYKAKYGILLDMIGAANAQFVKEGFSMEYAPNLVEKVWTAGKNLGHDSYFVDVQGGRIDDDHLYINAIAKIPTIDIIHLDPNSVNGSFFDYWHTINDDLSKIDKSSLKVVGETVLHVIYHE